MIFKCSANHRYANHIPRKRRERESERVRARGCERKMGEMTERGEKVKETKTESKGE